MNMKAAFPAPLTSFDSRGKTDFNAFDNLLAHLRDAGVKGRVPNGSTGEYNAMSADECAALLPLSSEEKTDFSKAMEPLTNAH